MDLTPILWNSLMATLAVALACYLASFHRTILFALVIALTLLVSFQFSRAPYRDPIETMGFIKLMFLLPFGLGSLLLFACLSEVRQKRSQVWFARYVNFAVAANIFIMIFTPTGETWRGLISRIVCLTLLVWLLQEMARKRFQTTHFDAGFFIFRSSPLHWVLCHACYRLALLSLPVFDSLHYLLLEPLSLLTMSVLYRLHQKRYPLHYYFGFADTIVVTTLAVVSRYPIAPPFQLHDAYVVSLSQNQLDMIFVPVQIIVIGIALRALSRVRSAGDTPGIVRDF
jgi:hypothetical protein